MGELSISTTGHGPAALELMNAGGGFCCPGCLVPPSVLQLEVRSKDVSANGQSPVNPV